MITALVIGTLLAVGALAFVLYPLLFGVSGPSPTRRAAPSVPGATTDGGTTPAVDEAVVALREIEFDRETGKLSDPDYAELKARYTRQAIEAMRRSSGQAPAESLDSPPPADSGLEADVEAAVQAFRRGQAFCPSCGARPEPDAVFCSTCGRYLREACAGCGAPVTASDARFCDRCGTRLSA